MKKAKEYYLELKPVLEGNDIDAIKDSVHEVFKSLIFEVEEIVKMRKCKTDSAWIAVIEEQNNKWNSICRKSEKDGMKFLRENQLKHYMFEELKIK